MEENDMQSVITAARQGVSAEEIDPGLLFIPTNEGRLASLEAYQNKPFRKRGVTTVFDAASLNMVLADNADAGDAVIYLDRDLNAPAIVAIMNDSGKTGPGWRDYRVQIVFRPTPQWVKWKAIDGKMMPQAAFAEFIEDNMADIAEPSGATMLEIATYLEATRTVNFKSGLRLSSGAIQFQNAEDIDAKVGAGKIEVPETFTLGLAPFLGTPSYRIPARFRYRLQDGKLTLGFKLQRVEDLMQQLIDDVVAKIERGANVSMIEGRAPDPVKS